MLRVQNLEVVYDDVMLVLRGVSISVPPGKIVALLGANGAGKTTLLRAVSGLLDVHDGEVTKGAVTLDDQPIHRCRPAAIVRRGVSQVMEGRRIFAELTVEENLRLGAHTGRAAIAASAGPGLRAVPGARPAARQQRRIPVRRRAADARDGPGDDVRPALPAARRAEPRPRAAPGRTGPRADRRDQQDGTGVLLVEQNATMALSIAEHGYVLETGKIVLDKPADELLADDDIREFYLGLRRDETAAAKSFRDVKHYKRRKRWLS